MAVDNCNKLSRKSVDVSGQRFGRLIAVMEAERMKGRQRWLCKCDCGNECIVGFHNLARGITKSCGCLRSEVAAARRFKHGLEESTEYSAWQGAKNRCYNPNYRRFDRYGGRGISMCDAWRIDFSAFLRDMGNRPDGYELDRIDNDGNYEPCNCRWSSRIDQVRNQSRSIRVMHDGQSILLKELAELTGVPYRTLYYRYKHDLPIVKP